MSAIQCQDLRKTYPGSPPVEAVRGIDLTVQVGECFGLLGPNGAGKTTTMEILEGLLDATAGEVELLGMSWGEHERELRQRIGISLQETKLSDKLTVREIITLFRSFYDKGLSPEEAIDQVQLQEKANARNEKLSGGQKQRLAVACALVSDPELLFLDEPTTGLDPQSRRQLWDVIGAFQQRGRTVLLTTHYMDEAERLCDRIAIVDHGEVIAQGTPRELIAQVGGEHVIEVALNGESARPAVEQLESLPGTVAARVGQEDLALTVSEPHLTLPALLDLLRDLEHPLEGLAIRSASLEDVFVNLTGRQLRDGEA